MVNDARRDACFSVATKEAEKAIEQFVPGFFQAEAKEALRNHPDLVRKFVNDILDTYEKTHA